MTASQQTPVTQRALLARVNRKLAADGQRMKQARQGTRAHQDLGDFYVIDLSRNALEASHCDLETWARDMGAMAPYERLVGE